MSFMSVAVAKRVPRSLSLEPPPLSRGRAPQRQRKAAPRHEAARLPANVGRESTSMPIYRNSYERHNNCNVVLGISRIDYRGMQ